MATYYFKVGTGEPFCENAVTGDDAVAKGQAIKTTNAPGGVESWRMKYNFSDDTVTVFAEGKDEAGAQDQKASEGAAAKAADKAKMEAEDAASKADA